MENYQYRSRTNAWVCPRCSALVDDPKAHDVSHEELITAMGAWAKLLDRTEVVDI